MARHAREEDSVWFTDEGRGGVQWEGGGGTCCLSRLWRTSTPRSDEGDSTGLAFETVKSSWLRPVRVT